MTIASLDGFEVPYPISGMGNFDIYPIGWAPNGNHFYFRKVSSGREDEEEDSLWAIDKDAQGVEAVIEDFSGQQMDHRDLAQGGDWVSLVSEREQGYSLSLMNTETNEKVEVDSFFAGVPVRSWSVHGGRLAYVKRNEGQGSTCTLYVLELAEDGREDILTRALPMVSELKWSPDEKKLLFRTATDTGRGELGMVDIDNDGSLTVIIEEVPEHFKNEWVDSDTIVYADGGKLMRMSISELTPLQLFPPSDVHSSAERRRSRD